MDKQKVVNFFDSLAHTWDEDVVKDSQKIDQIFDIACVSAGKTVLDVACGTGVLIPDYIERDVRKCVAIDISPEMVKIATKKFSKYKNILIRCADAEIFSSDENFDCIMIYNAFPHFVNHDLLFNNLASLLNPTGRITIAHSMGRHALAKHHSGAAEAVSTDLPEAEALAETMKPYFNIDTVISTDDIYIVSGSNILKSP